MSSFEVFFAQLPVRQVNGCRLFGPRTEDANFTPPQGAEIFVARIPPNFPHRNLLKILYSGGPFHDVRVMVTFMKENKGFAFVRYTTPEMAIRAMRCINGYPLPERNGHLVAIISTDHKTLLLTGCSPKVTEEDVENFFRNIPRAELVSVRKGYENGKTSPTFHLLFASHGSAAIVKKSNWERQLNGQWGKWVHLNWQPNRQVDQRQKLKTERSRHSNFNIPTVPFGLHNPPQNFGSLASTSEVTVQYPPESLLGEASNAFDIASFTPLLSVNGTLEKLDSFSPDRENIASNQSSLNEVSRFMLENQHAGNTRNQSIREDSPPNQYSLFPSSWTWGGSLLPEQNQQTDERRQAADECRQVASARRQATSPPVATLRADPLLGQRNANEGPQNTPVAPFWADPLLGHRNANEGPKNLRF